MQEASNFRIALYYTAGVIIFQQIAQRVAQEGLEAILGTEGLFELLTTWTGTIVMFVISLASLCLAVFASRWYLKRRQLVMRDKEAVIRLSAIIYIIVILAWDAVLLFIVSQFISLEVKIVETIIGIALTSLIFYLLSKKFVGNTRPVINP